MPSKYPVLHHGELEAGLKKLGFWFVSQNGSHMKFTNGHKVVIVPKHDEIAKGTLRKILMQADLSLEEFLSALK